MRQEEDNLYRNTLQVAFCDMPGDGGSIIAQMNHVYTFTRPPSRGPQKQDRSSIFFHDSIMSLSYTTYDFCRTILTGATTEGTGIGLREVDITRTMFL